MDRQLLQDRILTTSTPNRQLIVDYLKVIAEEVRRTPLELLAVKPVITSPRKFPANQAEELASDITMLIQFDLIDQDEKLDYICSLGSQLEMHPEDKLTWRALVEGIDSLG
jgi:DNA-binding transcriptional ArsR family regulator